MCYNIIVMKIANANAIVIPPQIVQEADNLAKETHIPFRDCLEVLVQAHLQVPTETKVDPVGSYR